MKGKTLTLTEVLTNGTLADVTAKDSFEILRTWYDSHSGKTRASIGIRYDESELLRESHTVEIREDTVKFAPGAANINTVARYKVE